MKLVININEDGKGKLVIAAFFEADKGRPITYAEMDIAEHIAKMVNKGMMESDPGNVKDMLSVVQTQGRG